MRKTSTLFSGATLGALTLPTLAFSTLSLAALSLAAPAQNKNANQKSMKATRTMQATRTPKVKVQAAQKIVRGEAFFLERIALPPGAKLHVSLVGRVAGAEYLPLSTTIVGAKNGITPFALSVPADGIPSGPYRLQTWLIADNRLFMQSREAQTTLQSLEETPKIRLKIVAAPQNIDGIGDGQPLPAAPLAASSLPRKLRGSVSKRDRRAISPDARIELNLRDVSLADAPSTLILGQDIQLDGKQLPQSFEMALAPDDLRPRRRYALSAKVFEAGKLTYITDTLIEVSPENAGKNFELRVVPAAGK
ncbi:putative lipoprotein YbaY [Abditibacterium utsteinense]|uniref:Putative lipoprotein YbaY n=1 Tax=Abditibacterium utsteinense TaxID=1960156 RepID=A0A2S8SXF1_9BACT|nr:YbaY family lipoprotein [Abditibacterium utsteinense]PQV65429.1 putative lipoprotein YbaY [Abditibacterium utsteinense]